MNNLKREELEKMGSEELLFRLAMSLNDRIEILENTVSVKSDNALERIADSLEKIESNLSDMNQSLEVLAELSDCISINGLSKIFCVTGDVTTCEG